MNSFRPARWSARNSGLLVITGIQFTDSMLFGQSA